MELERLPGYLAVAPILGICLLGLVLAIIRRDERSRVPLLVGTSAVLLAIVTILEPLSVRVAMERYPAPESVQDLNRFDRAVTVSAQRRPPKSESRMESRRVS